MLLRTAICDDESSDILAIQSQLKYFEIQFDLEFQISLFQNGFDLLRSHQDNRFQLIFLDVEMPQINGLEVAKTIRNQNDYDVKIIFISNYPKYMQDSFDVEAFHYLQKPLQQKTMESLLKRILKFYYSNQSNTLLLSHDDISEVISISDILYITTNKSQKDYLEFVLADRSILARGTLKDYKNTLYLKGFSLVHRGCLVNLSHVHYIKNGVLFLTNGISLIPSRRCEKELRDDFSKHILNYRNA